MFKSTFKRVLLVASILVAVPITPAQAPPVGTAWGFITTYIVGQSANQVRVQTTAPNLLNNNGCPTEDGYITNPSDPGNAAYQAALLGGYLSGKQVQLWVQGCYLGRPQIVIVGLQN
jgi:hypothetical protein